MTAFTAPYFQNKDAARTAFESIRWPHGRVCGRCVETERRYATKRPGRYRCGNPACRKDFTVMTGTVMERSHIPLHKCGFHPSLTLKVKNFFKLSRNPEPIPCSRTFHPDHRMRYR